MRLGASFLCVALLAACGTAHPTSEPPPLPLAEAAPAVAVGRDGGERLTIGVEPLFPGPLIRIAEDDEPPPERGDGAAPDEADPWPTYVVVRRLDASGIWVVDHHPWDEIPIDFR